MNYGPFGDNIHSWLLSKKSHNRYLGMFLVFGSLVGAWFLFLYQPLESCIDLEIQNGFSYQEQQINGRAAEKLCKKLEKKVKSHEQLFKHFSDEEACIDNEYITLIMDNALRSELIVNSCNCNYFGTENEFLRYGIIFKMQGTLEKTVAFFDAMEKSGKYIGSSDFALDFDNKGDCTITAQFDYLIVKT